MLIDLGAGLKTDDMRRVIPTLLNLPVPIGAFSLEVRTGLKNVCRDVPPLGKAFS